MCVLNIYSVYIYMVCTHILYLFIFFSSVSSFFSSVSEGEDSLPC